MNKTRNETSPASPVQGAAIASTCTCLGQCEKCRAATSSASGAKGAAVKPWEEREATAHGYDQNNKRYNAMAAEIKEWRALADRSPAVQPVAGQAALVEAKSGIEAMLLHFTATPTTLADSIARGHGHKAIGIINRILAATPAPEQEAAQVAPPGAQEAVGEIVETDLGHRVQWLGDFWPVYGTKLYTAPVPATTPAEQPEATADTLRAIRDEITVYYRALDSRQHGGVAQNKASMSIESALGMCWEAHRAAIKANN